MVGEKYAERAISLEDIRFVHDKLELAFPQNTTKQTSLGKGMQ